MGPIHSRRSIQSSVRKLKFGVNHPPPAFGYFILSFRGNKINVVNAQNAELTLTTSLIRNHFKIIHEGWNNFNLTYSICLSSVNTQEMIDFLAKALLSLNEKGWEPLAPINSAKKGQQTSLTICLKKTENFSQNVSFGSKSSMYSRASSVESVEEACLCLKACGSNLLGFQNVSNTTLHNLVSTIQDDYSGGVEGVSMGVASIIRDYTDNLPKIMRESGQLVQHKYIQLGGHPWTANDTILSEDILMSIVSCLMKEDYHLTMDINIDSNSRVFFFVKNTEAHFEEIRIPTMAGAGFGRKETLSVCRPLVIRSKLAFVNNYNRCSDKGRDPTPQTLTKRSSSSSISSLGLSYKPTVSSPAWWQQTSVDVPSEEEVEQEFEDEEKREEEE